MFISFEEYDKLSEEAEMVEIGDDYEYPSLEEAVSLCQTDEGIYDLLVAYYNTPNKEYRRLINEILKANVVMMSQEEYDAAIKSYTGNNFQLTTEEMTRILKIISKVEFKPNEYYPTKDQIRSILEENSEETTAYLLWLINSDITLTKEEMKVKRFIQEQLNLRIRLKKKGV